MPFKSTSPGCPCCEDDCLIPITGAETWAVGGGSVWDTSNLALITVSSGTSALLTFFPEHPEGKSTHVVEVQVKGEDDGDILQVVVTFNSVTTDYLYAELEVGTTGGYLRLFQVTGGSAFQLGDEVQIADLAPDEFHTVKVCYDGDVLTAIVNSDSTYWRTVTATGTYVGIATGAITKQATFKDFQWWIHYDDGGYYGEPNDCPRCTGTIFTDCIYCKDETASATYKVSISAVADNVCNCNVFNGTFILNRSGYCQWRSEIIGTVCGSSNATVEFWVAQAGAVYSLWVYLINVASGVLVAFNTEGSDPQGCLELDEHVMTFYSNYGFYCNGTSSIVKVTSL